MCLVEYFLKQSHISLNIHLLKVVYFPHREYKKKVEAAKAKMSALQKKQKETEKIANFSNQNDKK